MKFIPPLDGSSARALIPWRSPDANKGSVGRALLAAGSYAMPGAAVIAATGAICSGVGLLTLAFPDEAYPAVTANLTEAVLLPCGTTDGGFSSASAGKIVERLRGVSSCAVGPGLGGTSGARHLVAAILASFKGKLILDADALNILAEEPEMLDNAPADIGITPHPGEMSRLTGLSIEDIQASGETRLNTAASFAEKYGVTVLLKGRDTVIASPDGRVAINATGCPAMARGGSGDLLTGMALAFCSRGLTVFDALRAAAYYHGKAGEAASAKYGEESATVKRIAEEIRII